MKQCHWNGNVSSLKQNLLSPGGSRGKRCCRASGCRAVVGGPPGDGPESPALPVPSAPPGVRAPRAGLPARASTCRGCGALASPPSLRPSGGCACTLETPACTLFCVHPSGPRGPLRPVWGPGIRGCASAPFISWRVGGQITGCSSLVLNINRKRVHSPGLAGRGALTSRGVQVARVGRVLTDCLRTKVTPSRERECSGVVEPLV